MPHVVYVVPCYNEAARFDRAGFESLLAVGPIDLLFVDDGSTDGTLDVLNAFAEAHDGRVTVHPMGRNQGKGEAVRSGLLRALSDRAPFVGYADADLATPADELARLAQIAIESSADVIMGSRVARAGATIERRPSRHYLGRVFATYASILLDADIYDTQCGAKMLRAGPRLLRALEKKFVSRWVFDVELLGRLFHDETDPMPHARLLEVPLRTWVDVGGSHIRARSVPGIALDIARATRSIRGMKK